MSRYVSSKTQMYVSKDNGQTFETGVVYPVFRDKVQSWRDAWYGINGATGFGNILMRSLKGYKRTEWEVKP